MILVAGIGNIFLGDDAFGSVVARRMIARGEISGVRTVDFGIRGLDLAYALLDGNDATILIDTLARGGEPGTIFVLQPDLNELECAAVPVEAHVMDPVRVLALAHSMGAQLRNIYIVGCEPETFGPEEGQMELSPAVEAAVEPAIEVIGSLISKLTVKEAVA